MVAATLVLRYINDTPSITFHFRVRVKILNVGLTSNTTVSAIISHHGVSVATKT